MENHIPWRWSEWAQRFCKQDASGNVVYSESDPAKDRGVENPWGPGWISSASYGRSYKHEYGDDRTILETLWGSPGPPEEAEGQADVGLGRWSEWMWSRHYNSYYKLMYGNNEDIVLKTIWEPSSTKEAEMLINSARNAVHFAYRHNGYAIRSYYIPIQ